MQIFGDWDITQFLLLDKKISKERGLYACERESSLSLSRLSPRGTRMTVKRGFEFRPSPTSLTNEKKVAREYCTGRGEYNFRPEIDVSNAHGNADFNRISVVRTWNYWNAKRTRVTLEPPRLNIQFGFPRVALSRFIFIFLLFFLKGERERREIRPRLALRFRSLRATKRIRIWNRTEG